MSRILITGATGFLGKNLLECMDTSEHEIWILGRHACDTKENVHFLECDLRDGQRTAECLNQIRPEVLVLLAWDVSSQSYWESFENHIWSDSSIRLAHEFLERGGKQILFSGTSASYDYSKGWLKESACYEHPDSLYGITKLYTSNAIKRMAERYDAVYCEARLFAIYGKYERAGRLIPLTVSRLKNHEQIINTKGELLRDYIYVEDAARAIKLLLEQKAEGVYNISSGRPVSIHDIIVQIADLLDKRNCVAFEKTDFRGESPLIVGDNEKLKSLGFACRYSIEDGIRAAVAWLETEGRE